MAKKAAIKTGSGAMRVSRASYPFDTLKKKGDWFGVADRHRASSLRSQASKNGKARGVKYHVQLVDKGQEPFKLTKDGVVVMFDSYLNE